MAEDKLLTVDEVAKRFRVKPETISKWIEQDTIPYDGERFKESDVRKFLERHGRGERTNNWDALKPDSRGPHTIEMYRR